MVITQAEERDATAASGKSERSVRQPAAAWSTPSQLRKALPIVKLLAEVWAIPSVTKVGLLVDEAGIQVRVLVAEEDRGARAKVYAAERDYLNATSPHSFKLRVSPTSRAGTQLPASFETILER